MKTDTTLKQARHFLQLIEDKGTSCGQLQEIYDSGFFSLLLGANIAQIDKEKFLEVCGLKPSLEMIFAQMIAAGTMIIHRGVKVNRGRTPEEVIAAIDRKLYVDDKVLTTMPRGQGEVVDLYYIKANRSMSDDNLEKWLQELGLTPDPYAQAADNEANPAFADGCPNGTHWKNAKGVWCLSAFDRWGDERNVSVDRGGRDWSGGWWFGGRKLVL